MKLNVTTRDILLKKFKQSPNGYNPEEVDMFLDKILNDYRKIEGELNNYEEEIVTLRREVESLKSNIRSKDAELSVIKSKNIAMVGNKNQPIDNLVLLQRCSAYEKKLFDLGIDPSKIK